MIISHKYKFIFLKTAKTAGTSVEIALSRICGEDDTITPISKRDEILRTESGGRGPQNYINPGQPRFYNHMTSKEVLALIDKDTWKKYYKFCIERNPWDRVISHYYFVHRSKPRPSMTDFLRSDEIKSLRDRGFGLYTLNGQVCVDRIIDFANLEEELENFRGQLGVKEKLILPRAKGHIRKDKRAYSEIYQEEEKNLIGKMFAKEISLMGYSY